MKRTHIDFSYYDDHDLVPIEGVAEALGMTPDRQGKYLCVCHNDHKPSMIITPTGRFANKFKCFSCGESGDPLALTMAALYNVNPSDFFARPRDYMKELNDAAEFIEELYPGAIIREEDTKEENPFLIPPKLLKEIGLQSNFLAMQKRPEQNFGYTDEELKNDPGLKYIKIKNTNFKLEDTEIAQILCEKIDAYINDMDKKTAFLLINVLPNLSHKGKMYIILKQSEVCDELELKKQGLIKFLKSKNIDYKYEPFPSIISAKANITKNNIKIINTIYKMDPSFPKISAKLLGKLYIALVPVKDEIDILENINILNKGCDDYWTRCLQKSRQIIKSYPELETSDIDYINMSLLKLSTPFDKYQNVLQSYYEEKYVEDFDIEDTIDNEKEECEEM